MKNLSILASIACGTVFFLYSCTEDELVPEVPAAYQEEERGQENETPEREGYHVDIGQAEYEIGSEGGTVLIRFSTNVAESGTAAVSLNSTRSVSSSGHFARPRMAGFSLD